MSKANTLTRKEISAIVADKAGLNRAVADQAVEAMLNAMGDSIKAGNAVEFRGFGRFEGVDTPERQGRNPRTGETITIAAGFKVKFKAGKDLRNKAA